VSAATTAARGTLIEKHGIIYCCKDYLQRGFACETISGMM